MLYSFIDLVSHTKLRRLNVVTSNTLLLQIHFHSLLLQSILGKPSAIGGAHLQRNQAGKFISSNTGQWIGRLRYDKFRVPCSVEFIWLLLSAYLLVRLLVPKSPRLSHNFANHTWWVSDSHHDNLPPVPLSMMSIEQLSYPVLADWVQWQPWCGRVTSICGCPPSLFSLHSCRHSEVQLVYCLHKTA